MSKIIVVTDKAKEIYMSLYEFIDWQWRDLDKAIIVCHVTENDYKIMQKQIKRGGYLEELLPRSGSYSFSYNRYGYVMLYDNFTKNLVIVDDYENPNKKGYYVLERKGITYINNKNATQNSIFLGVGSYQIKVYTTETYDEIVAHYLNVV